MAVTHSFFSAPVQELIWANVWERRKWSSSSRPAVPNFCWALIKTLISAPSVLVRPSLLREWTTSFLYSHWECTICRRWVMTPMIHCCMVKWESVEVRCAVWIALIYVMILPSTKLFQPILSWWSVIWSDGWQDVTCDVLPLCWRYRMRAAVR